MTTSEVSPAGIGAIAVDVCNRMIARALASVLETPARAVREFGTVRRIAGDGW